MHGIADGNRAIGNRLWAIEVVAIEGREAASNSQMLRPEGAKSRSASRSQ